MQPSPYYRYRSHPWHYFATDKTLPGKRNPVEVLGIYGRAKALEAVEAALADYREAFASAAGEPTATR